MNPAPLPNIDSISPDTIYSFAGGIVGNINVNGSGFAAGQYPVSGGISFGSHAFGQVVNSTLILLNLSFDDGDYSPGFFTLKICENSNGTNCGTSGTMAFLGAQNYLAASSTGELFFLDQAQEMPPGQNGYVRKYKADGTADGSFFEGSPSHSIAVDNKTGNVLVDGGDYDENGGPTVPYPTQPASQDPVMALAAENGYGCFVQPANNSASCYNLVGGDMGAPLVTASNLGTTLVAIAMGVFGTETDAFVVSIAGTPSLYKVRASDAKVEGAALPLPGITPLSTVQSANPTAGGWQVVAFDSGPASGTVAVLSTYDQLLLFVNANTWTVTEKVVLTDTPFRITTDVTHGAVIVAYANPANATTTYASVDVASGTVTPLLNTSTLLSVGLAVSSDGTKLYSLQRDQIEVKQNQ